MHCTCLFKCYRLLRKQITCSTTLNPHNIRFIVILFVHSKLFIYLFLMELHFFQQKIYRLYVKYRFAYHNDEPVQLTADDVCAYCNYILLRGKFSEQLYPLRCIGVITLVAVRPMQLRASTGVLQTLSIDPSSPALLQTHIPSDRSNSPVYNELSPHSIFSHCGLSYR